jgi:hypothetical protein
VRLIALLLLAITFAASASAQPDPGDIRVLRTETVTGTLRGWEFGDYLWAIVGIGRPEPTGMWVGEDPIGPFMEAHRGRPLTLTVQTVSAFMPQAGGRNDVPRITGARLGRLTAQLWWRSLSPARRRAAQARFESQF